MRHKKAVKRRGGQEVWMVPKEGGRALRRRRDFKHFNQRQLGYLSECSHAFIGQLERGESTVSPELARQIAFRLECDVEDLFEERRVERVRRMPTANAGTSHPPMALPTGAGHGSVAPAEVA